MAGARSALGAVIDRFTLQLVEVAARWRTLRIGIFVTISNRRSVHYESKNLDALLSATGRAVRLTAEGSSDWATARKMNSKAEIARGLTTHGRDESTSEVDHPSNAELIETRPPVSEKHLLHSRAFTSAGAQ